MVDRAGWEAHKDGQKLVDDMKRATANKQKVDVLLSPHYFPDWAIKQRRMW